MIEPHISDLAAELEGERRLLMAILSLAIFDLDQRGDYSADAYLYILSPATHPGSFAFICRVLGADVEAARAALLNPCRRRVTSRYGHSLVMPPAALAAFPVGLEPCVKLEPTRQRRGDTMSEPTRVGPWRCPKCMAVGYCRKTLRCLACCECRHCAVRRGQ